PNTPARWYRNPGGGSGLWKSFPVLSEVTNESPTFADLTGDGRPELVGGHGDAVGYATPAPSSPEKAWTFHVIGARPDYHRVYTHGLGLGDINGDGRTDMLHKDGWWEQPASLQGDPPWPFHPFEFTGRGGAQMFAYDVDGDGLADVVTSMDAHGWGLSWFK